MSTLPEHYKTPLVRDLCEFVRIPSISTAAGGREGGAQRLMAQKMRRIGAQVRTFTVDDVPEFRNHPLAHGPERDYEDRPTVVGEMGPAGAPALLILAHSDTVDIFEPEKWTFDPFCGEVKDGKVLGRGAGDDKWGMAAMLVIMAALKSSGRNLKKRLIFATTVDEESGVSNGTLLLHLAGVKAEGALYLDGGERRVYIGNLGGSSVVLRPQKPIAPQLIEQHFSALSSACRDFSAQRAPLYDRPCLRENSTREASALVHRRKDENGPFLTVSFYTLPGETRDAFYPQLEEMISKTLGGDLGLYSQSCREPWFEPALIPDDTPMVRHLLAAAREYSGIEPPVTTISKQDAFVLTNHAGIPTVSYGVSHYTGAGAFHGPDEYIDIEEAWEGCCIAHSAVSRWLEEEVAQ